MTDHRPRPTVVIASEQPSARRFVDWDEWSAVADVVRDSIEAVIDA